MSLTGGPMAALQACTGFNGPVSGSVIVQACSALHCVHCSALYLLYSVQPLVVLCCTYCAVCSVLCVVHGTALHCTLHCTLDMLHSSLGVAVLGSLWEIACIRLHCTALHYTVLHCNALHCHPV